MNGDTYYRVRTHNTTYTLRCGMHAVAPFQQALVITAEAAGRNTMTLLNADVPKVGWSMHGKDCYGKVVTTPVVSVRKITLEEYAA